MSQLSRLRRIWPICLGLVVAGAAADLWVLERVVPSADRQLKDQPAKVLSPAEMEALLARIAPALPADIRVRLSEAVLTESARAGYDPLFILALVSVESRFRLKVASERGARGLVQLMPSTFAWISAREPDIGGLDADAGEDPVIDVRLAVRYFRWLEHRFRVRDDALMAYNAGPQRLARYKRSGEVPERVKEYPRRVKREYARFVRLVGGGQDTASQSEVLLARVQR